MISCGTLGMLTALISTEVGCSVVENFESVAGVMDGSRATFLVWRSYGEGRVTFEVFDTIRGLGCGWGG